jgi:hypothetical protein
MHACADEGSSTLTESDDESDTTDDTDSVGSSVDDEDEDEYAVSGEEAPKPVPIILMSKGRGAKPVLRTVHIGSDADLATKLTNRRAAASSEAQALKAKTLGMAGRQLQEEELQMFGRCDLSFMS